MAGSTHADVEGQVPQDAHWPESEWPESEWPESGQPEAGQSEPDQPEPKSDEPGSDQPESEPDQPESEQPAPDGEPTGVMPRTPDGETTEVPATPPAPDEPTAVFPSVGRLDDDLPTEAIAAAPPPEPEPDPQHTSERQVPKHRRGLRRTALITGAAVAALALLYGADLLINKGDVPRGVIVAGVDVGGMERTSARELLHDELEPRMTEPVKIIAGDVHTRLSPDKAGLSLDWQRTLQQAGDQSFNPITRLTSFFTTREVGVVTDANSGKLHESMAALADDVHREPVEGDIRFDGAEPVAVHPRHGQKLKVDKATDRVLAQWVSGQPLRLPVSVQRVHVTDDAVRTAMKDVAKPAVSAPVTVHGDGKDATLTPDEIAAALSFKATDDGKLEPVLERKAVAEGTELADTEQSGKDAKIVFSGGKPDVEPSKTGKKIDWKKTVKPLLGVLTGDGAREIDAAYTEKKPDLTTKEAKKLGVDEVIGKFTTTGFAPDSGVNIRKVAQEVNGAVVEPGETFSLNGYTGVRTKAQGYVEAGIIMNGVPATGVGGGISQFATTLYNASYFAGMKDAGHQEHSYYISRYPEAREATVFMRPDGTSIIDVKFTNDSDTAVAIQTHWTPSSITVKFWGTKHVDVKSVTGERHDYTDPGVRHVSDSECIPTEGQRGFTTSDTRIIRDADTGEVLSRKKNVVTYDPVPKVVCED